MAAKIGGLGLSFVRPEIAAGWDKWKQVILGAGIIAFAVYGFFDWYGLGKYAAGVIGVIGVLVAFDGWRRVRFPRGAGGLGVVEIKERRITYFSSGLGGSVSLDALQRCEVHRNSKGRITWVFYDSEGMLEVPGDAAGSDNLFDALVALPGVNYAQASAAAQGQGPDVFLIWAKDRNKLH